MKSLLLNLIIYPGDKRNTIRSSLQRLTHALKEWMDFRAEYGEKITENSWVMRDLWQTTNMNYGAKFGLATYPKKLKSREIKRLIERALWEQGIRQPLTTGVKRHEWKELMDFVNSTNHVRNRL